ncbi:sorting nexin 16 [Andrena cerasifolii]|uniref:sorting nexin 16 n=1 Tax=Andrena cerasifolii TaxID=2819439 RepID=UPI004037A906
MSTSESGVGDISDVALAISKARGSQSGAVRVLDSPDSDGSGHSNSFTVQRFNYNGNDNANSDPPLTNDDLQIPIVGYEVMEERARFTVYKLKVELKNGDCWFVFRRYTDFVRLLSQLRRQKIPISHLTLPRKKWFGDNFAPSFLEERIRGLQAFVNGILSNPILIGTACVREFFCLDEPPAISDTAEESRAIFEALKDTIYHLRQQLKEREAELEAKTAECNQLWSTLVHKKNVRAAHQIYGAPE